MRVTVSAKELLDSGYWAEFCSIYGVNEWAVNEGLVDSGERFEITVQEAIRWGLLKVDGD